MSDKKQETIALRSLAIGYKTRGKVKVVAKDITATIRPGELTCLLGTNGTGKSTLLHTLAAFLPKLEGEIILQGKPLNDYSETQLATLIGVVLTERLDLKNLSVSELVSLGRNPYTDFWGKLRKTDREIIGEAIRMVKIEDLATRLVDTLSDGERQKALIAKVLAQETPIILLDEPTAFLDYPSKVELMQLLHRLSREMNKTIFLSTHDLELALQMADKIWLMDKNFGVHIGAPEDLALDGSLYRYFSRKGITFDSSSGLFRIENKAIRKVQLTGEGDRYKMVQKALLRNGIEANEAADSLISIDAGTETNPVFTLHTLASPAISFTKIEDLLYSLNRQIN